MLPKRCGSWYKQNWAKMMTDVFIFLTKPEMKAKIQQIQKNLSRKLQKGQEKQTLAMSGSDNNRGELFRRRIQICIYT